MIRKSFCTIIAIYLSGLYASAQLTTVKEESTYSSFKDTVYLEEVVVKAPIKNIDSHGLGNISINMKQMQISPLFLGERDIVKTMQFLPGVSSGMEGSSQLNIRGGTNDQTLYLMDDIPVYNQNHTFGLFSVFNSDVINSVELYKGGIPATYGNRLSGIVSVDLKNGNFNEYKHSVSLGILAGSIASEGPVIKDKLSYIIGGRRSFIDLMYYGFMSLSDDSGSGTPMISFYDINGKLSWKLNDKTNISCQVYSGHDDLSGINMDSNGYSDSKYEERSGNGWQTFNASLRLQSNIKERLYISGNVYYSEMNNFNYYKSEQRSSGVKLKTENRNASLMSEIGGKLSFKHKISSNNKLYYGVEGANQLYTPEYIFSKKNNNKVEYNKKNLRLFMLSGYLNDEFVYKKSLFCFGLRTSFYNNSDISKLVFEPRIKVNTFINENNKLMIAYERMNQPMNTINEMDYNSKTDIRVPFHNSNLPKSDQISIGWKNYSVSSLSMSIELYYKSLQNLILIKNLEYFLDYKSEYESGKGKSKGIELMLEYSNKRFSAWTSYALSKTERSFNNISYPFKYDAPHDLSAFCNYVIKEKKGKNVTYHC